MLNNKTSRLLRCVQTNYLAALSPVGARRFKWYKKVMESKGPEPHLQAEMSPSDLKGRDLINFENWTRDDIFTLLWLAVDLKENASHRQLCREKSVSHIYEDVVSKTAIVSGIGGVGAVASSTHSSHVVGSNLEFLGCSLGSASDAIFIDSTKWSTKDLLEVGLGSSKPVINIRSADMAPVHALAECLTLVEHYGYLRRLTIAYVGPVENPMLDTYIHLYPRIGMHFRYFSHDQVNEDVWFRGIEYSNKSHFRTDLLHHASCEEAIFRAHVIVTTLDPSNPIRLNSRDMQEAELEWTFFHHDIQKGSACAKELIRSKQSLVWKYLDNLQWITKALLVATTTGYRPSCKSPGFQGVP